MPRTRKQAARQILIAVSVSLGAHVALVLAWMGSSLWGAWPTMPIDVDLVGMRLEDLQELPLGAPAAGDGRSAGSPLPPPAEAATTDQAQRDQQGAAARLAAKRAGRPKPPVTDPDGGAARPRPTSVRSYAPEGSRVTALMRLDRLRDTPYAGLVDALLLHLPDRRDLLEGTDLDLFRDVDALLIATPNPLDYRATLLAIRHHLSDRAVRAALERGARATDRKLAWRTERGRPFAERKAAKGEDPAARDQRLILLAAPHLAIVTPPTYRRLLLGTKGTSPSPPTAGDGGVDGGASASSAAPGANDWATLVGRIDAEDSVLPENAVAMLSLADVFAAHTLRERMNSAPASGAMAIVATLPLPRLVTATLGITPSPFADLDAEFVDEKSAQRWEDEWPGLRHQLLSNPILVLTGFSGIVAHTTLSREAATVHIRVDATTMETVRVLQLLSSQLTAMGR